jgi:homoserine kinase type II
MTSQLASEEALQVRDLLQAWPLGNVLHIQRARGGATHRVYRIDAERGAGFLRIYRRPDERVAQREHDLIAYVRAQGLPAPALLRARSGKTLMEHASSLCALYEPAQGQQRRGSELTVAQVSAAAELLARLHRTLATQEDVGYVQWTLRWDGPAWIQRLEHVESQLLERGLQDETDRYALERLRAQREWLAHPDCVHAYRPRSAAQVVHGDYQDANLFFDGERVSCVIDWEQAAFMPRGYEVARACWFMFRACPEPTLGFLRAYRQHNPLSSAELDDGARAWATFADHHVWPIEEAYLHGNDAARRYIPHAPFRPFLEVWAQLELPAA